MEHPERLLNPSRLWKRRFDIDWSAFPAVVFESDDWGACEVSRHADDAAFLGDLWEHQFGRRLPTQSTLESVDDLERLFSLLENHQGADGQRPVFTGFVATGNPDFDAIREHDYHDYVDIGIDEGFPRGWQRGDIVGKWREGYDRGVFVAEYHGNLHHTSPSLWLARLHAEGPAGEAARAAFDRECYYQGEHLPEYAGMNVRQQHQWIQRGLQRFERTLGYKPAAAVCSDAYPVTETLWSIGGVRTVCLKNARNNRGEMVIYHNKPWNNQDYYAPMGAFNELDDLIYLGRNVFFEGDDSAEEALRVIEQRWSEGEPAMVSTHRSNYVSLDADRASRGYRKLDFLLQGLTARGDVRFLTTFEVSDIYRRGWSIRRIGDKYLLRQYTGQTQEMVLPGTIQRIFALPSGFSLALSRHGDRTMVSLPTGDFLVDGQGGGM